MFKFNLSDYELTIEDINLQSKSWLVDTKINKLRCLKRLTILIYVDPPLTDRGRIDKPIKLWIIELRKQNIKEIKLLQKEIKKLG